MQQQLNWSTVNNDKEIWDQKQKENAKNAFLKLEEGEHEVYFIDDGVVEKNVKDNFNVGKFKDTISFQAIYLGTEKRWEMTYSFSPKSTFYDIWQFGTANGGVKGKTLVFRVKGKGQEKSTTLLREKK